MNLALIIVAYVVAFALGWISGRLLSRRNPRPEMEAQSGSSGSARMSNIKAGGDVICIVEARSEIDQ